MTATIESLRTFALIHNEIEFAHLCTAAISGEEWAIERIDYALTVFVHYPNVDNRLRVIRATDTTRPDGAIARSFEMP